MGCVLWQPLPPPIPDDDDDEVLLQGPSKKDPADLTGRSRDFKTTVVRGAAARFAAGDTVHATVTEATSHTLVAHPGA